MTHARFTEEERRRLQTLPAVARVTETRITYTKAFREECMARYWRGESGTQIFREAGLGPEVIGHKRIERCLARWRDGDAAFAGSPAMRRQSTAHAKGTRGEMANLQERITSDERIIVLQSRRIQELEDLVEQLRSRVHDAPEPPDRES